MEKVLASAYPRNKMKRLAVSLLVALLCCAADWSTVATPAPGPTQSIGFYTAAELPQVDRIFVNKWIKQRLCHTVTGNRAWLNKLVVWVGHDEHFHVRLYCPPGNPQCQSQAGYYADDGCGEPLDLWFRAPPVKLPPADAPYVPYRPKLPAACAALRK